MDSTSSFNGPSGMRLFMLLVVLAQAFGLTAVILVGVWMGHFRKGFAWQDDPAKEFNYHPLFMTIGMIFLYGDAILVYRIFRNDRKQKVKILHASLQILSFIFVICGLKAVFDSHNLPEKPIPNLYSLHSWIGIITVILFGLQWVFGFASFVMPQASSNWRAKYKSHHVFWGLTIFIMAIAAALMGTVEKTMFSIMKEYSSLIPEALVINCFGLFIVVFGVIVVYIVSNPNWSRQQLPEEQLLTLDE